MFSAEYALYLVIVRLGVSYYQFVKFRKHYASASCDMFDMNDVFLFHKWSVLSRLRSQD